MFFHFRFECQRVTPVLCAHGSQEIEARISETFITHNIYLTVSGIVMGKKKAGGGAGLGRALIKERLHTSRGKKKGDMWVRMLIKLCSHCPKKCHLPFLVDILSTYIKL